METTYNVTEKQFEALLVIARQFMWANPYPMGRKND
jgi:hypothetical protein